MKRANVEVLIGFLDAIRRRDRDAAMAFLDPAIRWQGLDPDAVCHSPEEVLDVFLSERDQEIEIEGLEVEGTDHGVVFAFHRSELPNIDREQFIGTIYHSCGIDGGRITSIQDHRERPEQERG
jgi:hypothetical protein